MEKVAGINYYPSMNSSTLPSGHLLEKSQMVRGHHSSINKAVEAHRQMVEERQSRNVHRDYATLAAQNQNMDTVIAQQYGDESSDGNVGYNMYENTLIEAPSTQAKIANIQSFQSLEPERPVIGEPVPKGSYIDVEA